MQVFNLHCIGYNNCGSTKQLKITVEASSITTFKSPEYHVKAPSNNNITVLASGLGTHQYALHTKTNTTFYRDYQNRAFFDPVSPKMMVSMVPSK